VRFGAVLAPLPRHAAAAPGSAARRACCSAVKLGSRKCSIAFGRRARRKAVKPATIAPIGERCNGKVIASAIRAARATARAVPAVDRRRASVPWHRLSRHHALGRPCATS
jgi:hypothetical protein